MKYLATQVLLFLLAACGWPGEYSIPVTVETPLSLPRVPLNPEIDFAARLNLAGVAGRFDRNSVRVINAATGKTVPHALSWHFHHGDEGEVRWVVNQPEHREYEIQFSVSSNQKPLLPPAYLPPIGIGDAVYLGAGVKIYRVLSDGNDFGADPFSDPQFRVHFADIRFEQFRKVVFYMIIVGRFDFPQLLQLTDCRVWFLFNKNSISPRQPDPPSRFTWHGQLN